MIRRFVLGPLETNCYLLSDSASREALVIDPGGEPEPVLDTLEEKGLKLKLIINTHGHGDHTWGDALLKEKTGAPLLIHGADAEMLISDNPGSFLHGFSESACRADRLLAEGEKVALAGRKIGLTVLHTPGHTPGSICLLGDGFIFVGDCLFAGGVGRTDLAGGSDEEMARSLQRLAGLPPELKVYPGHGPETTIGQELNSNPWLQDL